jgi:hypothetical protein
MTLRVPVPSALVLCENRPVCSQRRGLHLQAMRMHMPNAGLLCCHATAHDTLSHCFRITANSVHD